MDEPASASLFGFRPRPRKASMINLSKRQRFVVGLGWGPNESESGHGLGSSAFMLDEPRKVQEERFFVFYSDPQSPGALVAWSGDDRTCSSGDGGDDPLSVDLDTVDPRVKESAPSPRRYYDAQTPKQNFAQVRGSFIRIYDAQNPADILCKYELGEDFSVEFGGSTRRDGRWGFETLGAAYRDKGARPLEVSLHKYF
jgi:tellurium resistance protein TerD